MPQEELESLVDKITLRSSFSTSYATSSNDRKSNVKLALSKFNGLIVEPGEEVSFNNITGERTIENGYKNAKIIVGGKYVNGIGGGVCQASTTLYNAIIRSDIEVLQVNHHTLPASYVPLSFDAMVSEGYADLKFKNNLSTPIFIKTICDNSTATVEIYGEPFEDGVSIQTKAELVKVLPHGGDDIITDYKGEYEDKVLYRGEYYRLKYPQEGYESKGYVEYVKNGEVVWFGSNVVKDSERQAGLLDTELYKRDDLFDVDFDMSKADMLDSGESLMDHAMVITGVDLVDGKPTKWKIENSWGEKPGFKGYFVMSDSWFDKFVYQAVINKKYLSDDLKKTFEEGSKDPIQLLPWDPMGALANNY